MRLQDRNLNDDRIHHVDSMRNEADKAIFILNNNCVNKNILGKTMDIILSIE